MSNVAFNLQDHLRDMEKRLSYKIEDVHRDVKAHGDRVRDLEKAAEARETKVKWLIRTVSTSLSTGLAWAGWHLTNHP